MKQALNAQRIKDYQSGEYELGGGVIDPLPEDAPYFVKDYHAYYKTERGSPPFAQLQRRLEQDRLYVVHQYADFAIQQ